jgi:TolB-like protein/DNA-binding winged helix-turn-helix (wHTH) protein/Tfp pilus assembly protein PilF
LEAGQDTPQNWRFGVFEVDRRNQELRRNGVLVKIREQSFRVLVHLIEHAGTIVSREDLYRALWPADTFVDFDHSLNTAVKKLRDALGDDADAPIYIETIPKRGYRFIPPVSGIEPATIGSGNVVAEVAEIAQPAVSSVGPQQAENIPPSTLRKWRRKQAAWIAVAAAVLLLCGIGAIWRYYALHQSSGAIRSLAVIPLDNLSGDPEQEYFADGMTDELITNLAQIHSLRVISRSSVMQFKHTNKPLREIAAALNVDAVVEGSVSRAGDDVHITAQLLDARQDRHLWAATYERHIGDILGLQAEMAKGIADQVKAKLTPEEDARLAKRPPRNPEAYDDLLQARFLMSRKNRDSERLKKAIAYLEHAVAIDPNNAEAWAALGDGYASLGGDYAGEAPEEMRPKARMAIARALELDPNLAEGYVALAWLKMFDWDEAGAEKDFKHAIELNPNDSAAHRRYAFFLRFQNRFDEALEENRRAIDLAPLDIMPQIHLALIYQSAGLPDKEIAQLNRVLELDPGYTTAYSRLADAHTIKGQWPEALAALEHIKQTDKVGYSNGVAWIMASSGNMREANAAMADLKEYSRNNYVSPIVFASFEAKFGSRELALQWLQKAYKERDPRLVKIDDDSFDNLRSDPRFQALAQQVRANH